MPRGPCAQCMVDPSQEEEALADACTAVVLAGEDLLLGERLSLCLQLLQLGGC